MSATNPFEYGNAEIRDITHAVAKRAVRLVRAVANGRLDDKAIVAARGIILDIKDHRKRRQRAERTPRGE